MALEILDYKEPEESCVKKPELKVSGIFVTLSL
jgi:hypothetical protein